MTIRRLRRFLLPLSCREFFFPSADTGRCRHHAVSKAALAPSLALLLATTACSREEPVSAPAHDHGAMGAGAAAPDAAGEHAAESADEISHYTCPMHPSVHEAHPGKCPICGMKLVPVKKGEAKRSEIDIPEDRARAAGIRFVPLDRGRVQSSIRAPGRVVPAESGLADVTLAVGGFVRDLRVAAIGERVAAGDRLFTLYGPELVAAQAELIRSARSGDALARAARDRLRRLGIAAGDVDEIARRGVALEALPVRAPISGFVLEKNVVEGASVAPGERLLRISTSREVWIEAELFAPELAQIAPGVRATVRVDDGGPPLEATVSFVSPLLSPETRTGRVRLALQNATDRLRPEAWAEVEFAGERSEQVLAPIDAVVHSGARRLVFVATAEGRIAPREVTTGARDRERIELLSGAEAGERVVAAGTFLVAAESRLRSAFVNR